MYPVSGKTELMGELDGEKENEAEAFALPYVATRMASLLLPFEQPTSSFLQYEWNGVVGHVKAELSHVLRVPCV